MLLANAGTPLMWAAGCHLFFGNLIIGVAEAFLLIAFFRARELHAFAMVPANYLSMLAGMTLIGPAATLGITVENARTTIACMAAGLFALSVALEWPVVWLILRKQERALLRSVVASTAVHVASYAALAFFYLLASNVSLATQATPANAAALARTEGWVYYLDPVTSDVRRVRLDGRLSQSLQHSPLRIDRDDRLVERDGALWIVGSAGRPLDIRLSARSAPGWRSGKEQQEGNWFNFGEASDLQGTDAVWQVSTGFWAMEGLSAHRKDDGDSLHLAMECPFVIWYSRNAVTLPHGQVVYQAGEQILLLDLATRRIALLAIGQGPVVELDPPASR